MALSTTVGTSVTIGPFVGFDEGFHNQPADGDTIRLARVGDVSYRAEYISAATDTQNILVPNRFSNHVIASPGSPETLAMTIRITTLATTEANPQVAVSCLNTPNPGQAPAGGGGGGGEPASTPAEIDEVNVGQAEDNARLGTAPSDLPTTMTTPAPGSNETDLEQARRNAEALGEFINEELLDAIRLDTPNAVTADVVVDALKEAAGPSLSEADAERLRDIVTLNFDKLISGFRLVQEISVLDKEDDIEGHVRNPLARFFEDLSSESKRGSSEKDKRDRAIRAVIQEAIDQAGVKLTSGQMDTVVEAIDASIGTSQAEAATKATADAYRERASGLRRARELFENGEHRAAADQTDRTLRSPRTGEFTRPRFPSEVQGPDGFDDGIFDPEPSSTAGQVNFVSASGNTATLFFDSEALRRRLHAQGARFSSQSVAYVPADMRYWMKGRISFLNGSAGGVDGKAFEIQAGAIYRASPKWEFGGFFAGFRSDLRTVTSGTDFDTESYSLGLYANHKLSS